VEAGVKIGFKVKPEVKIQVKVKVDESSRWPLYVTVF
jgi:hypothetical protein